jgi:phosphoacetylglucosamine mutase
MIKYGTSGFRNNSTIIKSISKDIGFIIAHIILKKQESFGLMITASHNHYKDNGIKIMNNSGHMISKNIEDCLEEYINYHTKHNLNNLDTKTKSIETKIIIGYDSRESSPEICNLIIEGISSVSDKIIIEVLPYITTPELHFYFSSIKESYLQYISNQTNNIVYPCILDCANGIGSKIMSKLNHPTISLINTSWKTPELLNNNCSSDYVCTYNSIPINSSNDNNILRASLDGDADRIVFYYLDNQELKILNGDYIVALILKYLSYVFKPKEKTTIGFIYTGYTNQSCIEYIKRLQFDDNIDISCICTSTGVKHLHNEAEKYDIGVYFEQNGHGNIIFKIESEEINILKSLFHPNIGDGILDFFATLFILQELDMTPKDWIDLFVPHYSILEKQKVNDKNIFKSNHNELLLLEPKELQDYINNYTNSNLCRAFVRASGTENVVRIYVEGKTKEICESVYKKISQYIEICYK